MVLRGKTNAINSFVWRHALVCGLLVTFGKCHSLIQVMEDFLT